MHKYYDNVVPSTIHKAAYDYLQLCNWHSNFRHVPDSNIYSRDSKNDLLPYVAKKTIYRTVFGCNYTSLQKHAPVVDLFDYINSTVFNNKFKLTGKPLGVMPVSDVSEKEMDDYVAEEKDRGHRAYMQAQPYEPVKRTRIPHRDWDGAPLDSHRYYTIVFVANLIWNPIWHGEMFFYDDDPNGSVKQGFGIGEVSECVNNVPGRVLIYDSRALHSAKATSTLAPELSQRIGFRVKLKEDATFVRY